MRRLGAAVGLALLCAAGALHAQPAANCPKVQELTVRHLVGLWRAEFEAPEAGATLLLEPHPRYAGSLSGEVNRNGERSKVAADLDEGEFTLEESADGVRIAATWLGEVVQGSCGKEIHGSREAPGVEPRRFTLRRIDRW